MSGLSAGRPGVPGERTRDTRLDRTGAVKTILTTAAATTAPATTEFRYRFDREARAISALDHPHICTPYGVDHEGDGAYLVMQFIEGETLADRLAMRQ